MDLLNIVDSAELLIPIGFIGLIRYSAWLIKRMISSRWTDIKADGEYVRQTVGVAVTVKGEPVETFRQVLLALLREKIDQVNIVFDANEHENIAMTTEFVQKYGHLIEVHYEITNAKGKRKGLRHAIALVDGMDIIMCIDSDTILGDGVKSAVLETFNNSSHNIGGVTVKQRVQNPQTLPHYMFDIRLKLRYLQDLPGQAYGGRVSCLSGRCSAYLAEPLQEVAPGLTNERWAGIHKTGGGDDKYLTTAIHDLGYHTVAIVDAIVYTRPEDKLGIYLNQSLRWARNSWFSDIRALFSRKWMWKSPILLFYTLDRFMSTFTMLMAIWFMLVFLLSHAWGAALILFLWWMITRTIKIWPYLWETKRFHIIIPYIFMTLAIAIIKIHALITLSEKSWLTRQTNRRLESLRKFQQLAYRSVTGTVILFVGAFVFLSTDVWLADIPLLANLGNFYRPEDNGLYVEDDLIVDYKTTIAALPYNPSTLLLNEVKDTALRLNEEFAEAEGEFRVVWTSELTRQELETANLLLFGGSDNSTEIGSVLQDLYIHPKLGERLADAEPFASEGYDPIRFTRSPWNSDNHILLVNVDNGMRFRLKGKTVSSELAQALIAENMGAQFVVNDTPNGRRADGTSLLAGWDVRETLINNTGTMSRTYGLNIPHGLQFNDDLSIVINTTSLRQGTSLDVLVNETPVGSVDFLTQPQQQMTLQVQDELANEHLSSETDERLLTITLIVHAAGVDNAFDIWQTLDHEIAVLLPLPPVTYDLSMFPYPYTFNPQNTPILIIMPDQIRQTDIELMIRLIGRLGISAPNNPIIEIKRSSEVTSEDLQANNVMILGEKGRQPYAGLIENDFFQKLQFSFYHRMPNDDTGIIYMLQSPWNRENTCLLISSEQMAGYEYAVRSLVKNHPIMAEHGYLAFVDEQLTVRTLKWSEPQDDLFRLSN